ncbi:MAG TPA: ATP-binding protein [Puia sp.]|nr:ATP-binding protein [Puia sp.]
MKKASTLTLLLLFSFSVHSQDEAILALQQRLPSITDSFRFVDALNRIGMLSYEQNVDTTLFYANKAREIARRINYTKGIADATNNLAVYFDINGNAELALRYYSDAHQQYITLGDSSNLVQTLMNIAMVYNTKGNDEKAMDHYRKAMALGSTLRQDSIMSIVIYNFLLQYPQQFATDSVDQYIEKTVRIAQKYHDIRLLLAIEQLKAHRYMQQGQRAAGIRLLEHALAGGIRQKLFFMSMDILGELGDLYSETDSTKAVAYYRQALNITKEKNYGSYEMAINNKLYDFYIARKDKETAYEYSAALVQLYRKKQEIDNQSGIDYITYAIKDQQLGTIRAKTVYADRLLWLEGIACILAAVIIFMLWRNGRQNKRIHATLEEQYKKLGVTTMALENSNKNYARLIRVVAHDLRNPIGAINSITGLIMNRNSPAQDKESLQLVEKASKRCLQLITELLETDFEIREETLQKESVDVADLLQQAAQLLAYRAAEKKQRLVTQEGSSPVIRADRDKLARVLDNLVVNAIKFSPEGATVKLILEETQTGITISVHDDGVGIPPEIAAKLFEPFENSVKRKGTSGERSFGLGLYICRQIVVAHRGRIWFESHPGRGSTFFVSLQK